MLIRLTNDNKTLRINAECRGEMQDLLEFAENWVHNRTRVVVKMDESVDPRTMSQKESEGFVLITAKTISERV